MTDSSTPTGGIEAVQRQVANARMGLVPAEREAADGDASEGTTTA